MRLLLLSGLGLVFAPALGAAPADGAQQQKKKPHFVKGTVVAVHHDKDKKEDLGYITVKVPPKKKQAEQGAKAREEKVVILKDTKFVQLGGKKAKGETTPAHFHDVHKGAEVLITPRDGHPHQAERVALAKKKKKAAATE
jgi:hypothetical protein